MTNSPPPAAWPRPLDASNRLLEQARSLIPGITTSLMKRPEQFCPGEFPTFLARGEGARVFDVDGNEYVDFICGLGANSLGHNHPTIVSAIGAAHELGLLHSLPTEHEVVAAQHLVDTYEIAEMVRFFKTGADATSAAIRLARAVTGRQKIVTVGYNGWHDHFMFDTPGVPATLAELTRRIALQTPAGEPLLLDAIRDAGTELAAVLLSVPYNRLLSADFVARAAAACRAAGGLFIIDDIVTGFRVAPGGAQEYFGSAADLVCCSKALAAGMPLSAVAGPRRIMERMTELQVSTTFGGEILSLAACTAAGQVYRSSNYYAHVAQLGAKLREGVNEVAARAGAPLRVVGYDAIPMFSFSQRLEEHVSKMRRFQGAMARRGILLRRDVNFISLAHTEAHVDHLISASVDALDELGRS